MAAQSGDYKTKAPPHNPQQSTASRGSETNSNPQATDLENLAIFFIIFFLFCVCLFVFNECQVLSTNWTWCVQWSFRLRCGCCSLPPATWVQVACPSVICPRSSILLRRRSPASCTIMALAAHSRTVVSVELAELLVDLEVDIAASHRFPLYAATTRATPAATITLGKLEMDLILLAGE